MNLYDIQKQTLELLTSSTSVDDEVNRNVLNMFQSDGFVSMKRDIQAKWINKYRLTNTMLKLTYNLLGFENFYELVTLYSEKFPMKVNLWIERVPHFLEFVLENGPSVEFDDIKLELMLNTIRNIKGEIRNRIPYKGTYISAGKKIYVDRLNLSPYAKREINVDETNSNTLINLLLMVTPLGDILHFVIYEPIYNLLAYLTGKINIIPDIYSISNSTIDEMVERGILV